jgi:rubrerythrin
MKLGMTGRNRTGASRAPDLVAAMIDATAEFGPSSRGDANDVAAVRIAYARSAYPVGTMPAPAGAKNLAKTALRAVTGGQPVRLLDKLGERAAFERTGTRLYDALLSKHDAGLGFRGGPSRADILEIRNEEHAHFLMLSEAIAARGGDPTVLTPSANVQATAGKGVCAVLADARTNVLECLEALLGVELIDNDGWPALIELAENAGDDALAARFTEARAAEVRHLERVRTWVALGNARSAERARVAGEETARQVGRAAPATTKSAGTAPRRRAAKKKTATSARTPRKGRARKSIAKKKTAVAKTSRRARR